MFTTFSQKFRNFLNSWPVEFYSLFLEKLIYYQGKKCEDVEETGIERFVFVIKVCVPCDIDVVGILVVNTNKPESHSKMLKRPPK